MNQIRATSSNTKIHPEAVAGLGLGFGEPWQVSLVAFPHFICAEGEHSETTPHYIVLPHSSRQACSLRLLGMWVAEAR
jgi:hypothetical protein